MNVPIRIRLTAWYAALMAAVIVVLGGFVVLQLRNDLERQVDDELRAVSDTMVRTVRLEAMDSPPRQLLGAPDNAEDFEDAARTALPHSAAAAQVIGTDGHVVLAYGPAAEDAPLADHDTMVAAQGGGADPYTLALGEEPQDYRVHATSFTLRGDP